MEAAESLFTPLCIYNNTKGDADAAVREAFEEPSWNNPVVRVVTADRKDLVPRVNNRWTVTALADAMVASLTRAKRPVPTWLRLAAAEARGHARGVESAIFGMG